jgi:uncharacterized membrane protein YjjB (DUF3815 family)
MLMSAGAAGVGYLISIGIGKIELAAFIRIFICCLGATLTVLVLSGLHPSHNMTAMIVSAVTIFMPGVAITNAARDLLSGDMLSGVARATDAAVTGLAIAGGAGIIAGIWTVSGGTISADQSEFPLPVFAAFGFLMTLGICLIMNAPRKQMVLMSAIGGAGMLSLVGGSALGFSALLTTFLGTCIVALLSELASRAGRDATTVFIIPGIIPFVPGFAINEAMYAVLTNDIAQGIERGANALLIAGSIAIALIVVATGARLTMALARRASAKS